MERLSNKSKYTAVLVVLLIITLTMSIFIGTLLNGGELPHKNIGGEISNTAESANSYNVTIHGDSTKGAITYNGISDSSQTINVAEGMNLADAGVGIDTTNGNLVDGFSFPAEVKQIVAGAGFTSVLLNDGTVWGIGSNTSGQLGVGDSANKIKFVQAKDNDGNYLNNVDKLFVGNLNTFAIKHDSTIWGTGSNTDYIITNQNIGNANSYMPIKDNKGNDISNVKDISIGEYYVLILKNDDTVWGFGRNTDGQLGSNGITFTNGIAQLKDSAGKYITDVKQICAGYSNTTVILKNDGTVWSTGGNFNGQLADGSKTNSKNFIQAKDINNEYLSNVIHISTRTNFVIALKADGTLWGVGSNTTGQLSLGNKVTQTKYVQCKDSDGELITGVKAVYTSYSSTYIEKDDGTVWSSGGNTMGQLGNGTLDSGAFLFSQPIDTNGETFKDVQSIVGGNQHWFIIKKDGSIWGTGQNKYGNLGVGSSAEINIFTRASLIDDLLLANGAFAHDLSEIVVNGDMVINVVYKEIELVMDTEAISGGIQLNATLRVKGSGEGIEGKEIAFCSGDYEIGKSTTDANGKAGIVAMSLSAGVHNIVAEYKEANVGTVNNTVEISHSKALTENMVGDITETFTYDGTEHKPIPIVTDEGTKADPDEFDYIYSSNVYSGKATVVVKAKVDGSYTGSVTRRFNILRRSLTEDMIGAITESFVFDGNEKKPEPTVSDGDLITADDYRYVYTDNTGAGQASVSVTAADDGNYTGRIVREFEIEKAERKGTVSISGWKCGESPNEPSVSENIENGEVIYEYSDSENGTYSADVPAVAGTFWVRAKIGETNNYKSFTTAAVSFEIYSGEISASVSIDGWTYGDIPNEPSVSENPGGADITYEYSGNENGSYSTAIPSNAGQYWVRAKFAATADYDEYVTAPSAFEIAKAEVGISGTGVEIVKKYDGSADVTADITRGVHYELTYSDGLNPDVVIKKAEYNGTDVAGANGVEAVFGFSDDTNYKFADGAEMTLTLDGRIDRADSEIGTEGIVKELTYNGSEQTVNDGAALNHNEATLKYSNNVFTNVPNDGILTVTVAVEESANYNACEVTAEIKINKAETVIDTEDMVKEYTYTGEEQTVIGGAALNHGEAEVEYGNNTFTTVNEGNGLLVEITSAETENYKAGFATIAITVKKAKVKTPELASKVFSGETLTADVPESELYTVTENNGGSAKGTYDVVLTLNDADNYEWDASVGATLNGADATLKFVITGTLNDWAEAPNIDEQTEYGTEYTVRGKSLYGEVNIEYKLKNGGEYSTVKPSDAGEYTARFSVEGTDDYGALTEVVDFTITPKNTKALWNNETASYIFDGSDQFNKVTAKYKNIAGEEAGAEINLTSGGSEFKSAGSYEFTASTSDGNYKLIDNVKRIYMLKASYNMNGVIFDNKTIAYNGESHSLAISGELPDGVSVEYTNNGQTDAGNYTVTAAFGGDAENYNPIKAMTAELIIEKADYDMSGISFEDRTAVYNAEEQKPVLSGELPIGLDGIRLTAAFGEGAKNVSESGKTVTVTFATESKNYNVPESMTAAITIEKAEYDMTGVSFDNAAAVYDGTEQGLTVTGELPAGVSVTYGGYGVNAGEYEITAYFSGDAENYEAIDAMSAVLTIEKATFDVNSIRFGDKAITYDGEEHGIVIEGELPDGITVTYVGGNRSEVGVYTVTAKFNVNGNYNAISDMTATLTIGESQNVVDEVPGNDGKGEEKGGTDAVLLAISCIGGGLVIGLLIAVAVVAGRRRGL